MARTFAASSFLSKGVLLVPVGASATFAAWVNPNSNAGIQGIIAQGNYPSYAEKQLSAPGVGGGNFLYGNIAQGANSALTVIPPVGVWSHAAVTFNGTTIRSVYLNGTNKVTNSTTTSAYPTQNLSLIGATIASNTYQGFNGLIAFPAIWNIILSDADIAALALGISPLRYHPTGLVAYLRDSEGDSPVPDLVSATPWTLNGSPVNAPNPRIYG